MAGEKGFGTPSEIIIDGRRMSREEFETHIAESGVPQVDVKRFALTRINGVVKLYMDNWTVAVGLMYLDETEFARFAAGSIFIGVPIVVLYFCLVRYMVNGMAAGAVKE